MNQFATAFYLGQPAAALLIALILLGIVVRHIRERGPIRIFCLVVLSVALWSAITLAMRASPDPEHAVVWDRFIPPITIAMSIFYFHFSVAITRTTSRQTVLTVLYSVLFIVALLTPTSLLVSRMYVRPFGYAPVFTWGIIPIFLLGFLLIGYSFIVLVMGSRRAVSYDEKNRLTLVVIAMVFPLLGGVMDVFIGFFPASMYCAIIFCLLTSIAIFRFHLFDIQLIVRKSLTYLLTSSVIAIPYVVVLAAVSGSFGQGIRPWWAIVIAVLLLAFAMRPLYTQAQRLVDKAFYRDRYDSLTALLSFSQKSHSVTDLEELGKTMVELVSTAIRTSAAYLFARSESRKTFVLKFFLSREDFKPERSLGSSGTLVKWMERSRSTLSVREIDMIPQLLGLSLLEKKFLAELNAELLVPVSTKHGDLAGIIILGSKLSEQFYSTEDIQLLEGVSRQMGMALENALLYEEATESERAQKESEKKLRLVFNSVNDGIAVFDQGLTIIEANRAAARMHGCQTIEELVGKNLYEIFSEQSRSLIVQELNGASKNDVIHPIECVLLRKDGSEFPGEIGVATIQGETGMVIVIRDISERKQAEQREKRLQEEIQLSHRLASLGRLTSGVAHEINNPLTAVVGFSERLLRKEPEGPDKKDLEIIFHEAQRIAKVVEDLRTFARRKEPKRAPHDVNEIIKKALEVSSYGQSGDNVQVRTELSGDLPPVIVDFQQTQQVFLNLIVNARQAITESKHGRTLVIITAQAGNVVKVSFEDDGPGIPPEVLSHLFEPFFTTRGDRGGTGLGLSICHGIVTDHGGRIYAESVLGKGTTFVVEFPVHVETSGERSISENTSQS